MGLDLAGGEGGGVGVLKDMKVLIGQRGNREVYAERLLNGQASFFFFFFLSHLPLCESKDRKRVRDRMPAMLFKVPEEKTPGRDVTRRAMC